MIGEALGNYRLVAKLGSGSMGVVFLAQHQRIARQVAIKLLDPDLVRNQHVLQRFFNEARAASLIRHPGIVDVFDCDVDPNGRAYMVMEHLEGETLAERLRQTGRLHWIAACLIAGQLADALGAVHDQKIVHRDLKPENVFLVGDPRAPAGAVKILDFGVAKLLAIDAAARLTMRGMLVGTPEYMSPEQCGGSDAIDHRADVYALGCILFEMLSGQPPFVAPTLRELMAAHRFGPVPSLAAISPEVPAWLRDLLARMLAKEPGQRPSSMHEVSKELRKRKAQGPAVAPAMTVRAVVERAARPREPRVSARPTSQRLVEMIAIALTAVCVLTGAVWAVHRNSGFGHASQKSAPILVTTETFRATSAPIAPVADEIVNRRPPPLPAAAATVPTTAPLRRTGAPVDPLPLERRPESARPVRPVRPPARQPRDVVDSDGIVDL